MPAQPLSIGFIVNDLSGDYQQRVFAGLLAAAEKRRVRIVCLVGGPIGASGTDAPQAELYSCVSSKQLDGLVVVTGAIIGMVEPATLREFMSGFGDLPICSVGVAIDGIASVTVDNASGERAAFKHLVEKAGRRRIAFIRGPRNNPEAEARFAVYKALLEESHLAFDPDLVADGNFDAITGRRAVATFLDERHVAFDAIMAANDLIALGAMNALLERKVPVPDKVSIVGFDDIEGARFAASPLTTVRQPLLELGNRALDSVLAQVDRRSAGENLVLQAELVERDSTARHPTAIPDDSERSQGQSADASSLEGLLDTHALVLEATLGRLPEGARLPAGWAGQVSRSFLGQLVRRRVGLLQPVTFAQTVESLLLHLLALEGDATAGHQLISAMRGAALPLLQPYPEACARAENLLHDARISCSNLTQRYHVQGRLQSQFWRHAVQEVGARLLRCKTWDSLASIAYSQLPEAGVHTCYLFTFETGFMSRPRLILQHGKARAPEDFPVFPASELLPPLLRETSDLESLLAYSLFDESRALGYVVFQLEHLEPPAYELLRDYLTGAIRGIAST